LKPKKRREGGPVQPLDLVPQGSGGLVEAAWLVMVLLIPVYFNTYTSRIFEADKAALLRALAVIVAAAGLAAVVRAPRALSPATGSRWRRPLVVAALAWAAAAVVSTALALSPRLALVGSFERQHGLGTVLACVVAFIGVAFALRRGEQVDRLLDALLLATVPVCGIALLQRLSLDPLPWGRDMSLRVASSFGNPIFLGAFLCMVIPLTLHRVLAHWSLRSKGENKPGVASWLAALEGGVLVLQVVTLFLTGSRGPMVGVLAGLFFLALVEAARRRHKAAASALLGAALVGVLCVLALNLGGDRLQGLRETPLLARYSRLLDPDQNSSRVRTLIWDANARLVRENARIEFADGRADPWRRLRPLVGYGPENLKTVFFRFYPPELALAERRTVSADRSHNFGWDLLTMQGLLGLAVYLGLIGLLIHQSLVRLGLLAGRRDTLALVAAMGAGAVALCAALAAWRGAGYLPLGIVAGALGGLVAYLAAASHGRVGPVGRDPGRGGPGVPLGAAILASLLAHVVESQFGIVVVATALCFWVLLGVVAAEVETDGEFVAGVSKAPHSPWADPLAAAVLASLLTGAVLFAYTKNAAMDLSAWRVLRDSLLQAPGRPGAWIGVALVVTATWIAALLLPWLRRRASGVGDVRALTAAAGLGALLSVVYAWANAAVVARLAVVSGSDPVAEQARRLELHHSLAFLAVGLAVVALGWALQPKPRRTAGRGAGLVWTSGALAGALALALAFKIGLVPCHADLNFKLGETLATAGRHSEAVRLLEAAQRLAPSEDMYPLRLGGALMEAARVEGDAAIRETLMAEAIRHLSRAQRLEPANRDHAVNLGRAHRNLALFATDPAVRRVQAETAASHYAVAARLSPNQAEIWEERSMVLGRLLGRPDEALSHLRHSLEVDPYNDWTHALIGNHHFGVARQAPTTAAATAEYGEALRHYDEAIRLCPERNRGRAMEYHLWRARVFNALRDWDQAVAACRAAMALGVQRASWWRIHKTLALLHQQAGRHDLAMVEAAEAVRSAPDDAQRRELQDLFTRLQQAGTGAPASGPAR
jgi:tetratricopeptide (TPR) repeat protein